MSPGRSFRYKTYKYSFPKNRLDVTVNAIRERERDMTLEAAVDAALDEMPEGFLIRTYLEANRVEVKKMLLTEYNETRTMEMFKREGREEGIKAGLIKGLKEGRGEGEAMCRRDGPFDTKATRINIQKTASITSICIPKQSADIEYYFLTWMYLQKFEEVSP